jgi:SAM-dependent methyltransferase
MDAKAVTIATYDAGAAAFVEKFDGRVPRVGDIETTLRCLGTRTRVNALELGCGAGKEAGEIAKRVDGYVGIDASKELIAIARERNPGLRFEHADMETYAYPRDLDAVFAFASFIHVAPDRLRALYRTLYRALTPGGVVFCSMQCGEGEDLRAEPEGTRLFHLYTPDTLRDVAGEGFEEAYHNAPYRFAKSRREWFETVLRKR